MKKSDRQLVHMIAGFCCAWVGVIWLILIAEQMDRPGPDYPGFQVCASVLLASGGVAAFFGWFES